MYTVMSVQGNALKPYREDGNLNDIKITYDQDIIQLIHAINLKRTREWS